MGGRVVAQLPRAMALATEPMNDTQVLEVVAALLESAQALLTMMHEPQAQLQSALEGVAVDTGQALHAVTGWMPRPDVETRELMIALEGFLP